MMHQADFCLMLRPNWKIQTEVNLTSAREARKRVWGASGWFFKGTGQWWRVLGDHPTNIDIYRFYDILWIIFSNMSWVGLNLVHEKIELPLPRRAVFLKVKRKVSEFNWRKPVSHQQTIGTPFHKLGETWANLLPILCSKSYIKQSSSGVWWRSYVAWYLFPLWNWCRWVTFSRKKKAASKWFLRHEWGCLKIEDGSPIYGHFIWNMDEHNDD